LPTAEAPSTVSSTLAKPPAKPLLSLRPPRGWTAMNLAEVWRFRDLLVTLAGRDLKVRYKQTALGVIWVVLQPLLAAGVFSMVFGKIGNMPSDGIPYFLFSYAGMLGWNLFSNVLSRSSACLVGNANLISKVYFPRLVLPLSTVGSALVDYAVSIGMLAVLMVIYHVQPSWGLLMLPAWTAVLLLLSLGIGLFAAALTVSYRDVQYVLPVALNIFLFASPVAYSAKYAASRLPPQFQTAYFLNPLAPLMESYRCSILGTSPAPGWALWISIGISIAAFWIGAVAFKQMERKFADVI
jgi:lipopolysaccharide transport system permease protein